MHTFADVTGVFDPWQPHEATGRAAAFDLFGTCATAYLTLVTRHLTKSPEVRSPPALHIMRAAPQQRVSSARRSKGVGARRTAVPRATRSVEQRVAEDSSLQLATAKLPS